MTANNEGTLLKHRVFLNGKVITMDAGDFIAEAVAIQNGSIEAVGSTEEIRKLVTTNLTRPYHVPFKGDKEYKGYPVTRHHVLINWMI